MSKHQKILSSLVLGLIALVFIIGENTQTTHAKSPSMATPVPLACDGSLYQVISGQLKRLDLNTGVYTNMGDDTGFNRINAMGYNLDDNFLYALARQNGVDVNGNPVGEKDIIKLDANGDVYYHVSPSSFIQDSVVADVVDGKLWILKGTDIYNIDLASGAVQQITADASVPIVDWGYIDGKFYGANNNVLYVVDPSTSPATVTTNTVPGLNGASYGAAYIFETEELFVSSNTGGVYQIIGYDTPSPVAFYVSNSEVTNSNDGASCPTASFIPPPPPPPSAECGPEDVDTDGDGVIDSIDLDNDNDGILDSVENLGAPALVNADFETYDASRAVRVFGAPPTASFQFMEGDVEGWETTAPDNQIEIWQSGHLGFESKSGDAFAEINSSFDARMIQDFDTNGGDLITWSIWHRGRGGVDKSVAMIGVPGSTLTVVETMETGTAAWVNYKGAYRVPTGQTRTRLAFESVSTGSGNQSIGNFLDGFDILMFADTDLDGIPDGCDLDSDNDGISDLIESGATVAQIAADTNDDGYISTGEAGIAIGGPADGDGTEASKDGLMDIFNSGPGTDPVNSDETDRPDFLDLDSDNDGIPDAVEAQPTDGYVNTFGTDNNVTDDDADGDGAIGIYDSRNGVFGGSFEDPQNTDGDELPDYLDLDSDNDSKSDTEEHGLGPENGGPANPTYPDPNGRINDPQSTLLNESGDNTEVAYRELWIPPTIDPDDKDGDDIPNAIDIDDDNDGILDVDENEDLDDLGFVEDQTGRPHGMGSSGNLSAVATNNCPGGQVAVALYGGSLTRGMIGANSVDSLNNGICVQLIAANDWASMSVEDFQTFDLLWIGNDDCTAAGGAAAFDQAVASRPVWETAIDPGNLMIAGGDYDYHVFRNGGGDAREITEKMIKESADGTAPGLVLQAGCYSVNGEPWYQNLGGTFEGLYHGGVGSANPGDSDVTSHEFNGAPDYWDANSYAFNQSCHGGIYIVPESPMEQYNLQVLFYYPGGVVPCFMMSDERFPPFFPTRDTDNDGIPDACDLDSDNDGISDLIESGATAAQLAFDTNNDGTISPREITHITGGDPDADGDGLMDIFDQDIEDPTNSASVGTIAVNSDGDIRHDFIDLDSDADGIPDAIEGKPTKLFDPTYRNDGDVRDDDIDSDGVITVFDNNDNSTGNFGGTFVLPEDTDEDGIPDYLDLDSDNDFALDEWESGLFPTGSDNGNFADGIDDAINPSEFYRDNNGIVDLPWRDLADEDNDAELDPDGDVDFREFNPDFDFGDAPNIYGIASHSVSEFVDFWIGAPGDNPDIEELAFPTGNGVADDLTGIDDEEGVTWNGSEDPSAGPVFYPASPPGFGSDTGEYSFNVQLYNDSFDFGFLNIWIDFDGNNVFDSDERLPDIIVPRSAGVQTQSNILFDIPDDAACGRTYARFRFTNEATIQPEGYGGWGEVEDHAILIDCSTDLEVEMEFEPNVPGVNDIALNASRVYEGEWELSHDIAIRTFVKNNGPQSARNMTVTVELPQDMDDVAYAGVGRWSCTDVAPTTTEPRWLATCTAFGMIDPSREEVLQFTGRIPGTYDPNFVIGNAEVDHEGGDPIPENNRVDHNIRVVKIWEGVEEVETFIYGEFSSVLNTTLADGRDIGIGDKLANPIQVPIYYAAGVEPLSDPILRTRWCSNDPTYPGCDELTDYIIGVIAVESHTTLSVTEMIRTGSGVVTSTIFATNLISGPIETMAARDVSDNPIVRYSAVRGDLNAPAFCETTISDVGNGKCIARQDVISGFTLTSAQAALYDWDIRNLTPIVFQTSGGRTIECDNGDGECVYVNNARPGLYLIEGLVNYQVVFPDVVEERLGVPIYREYRASDLSFFMQVIAPYVEPEDNTP